MTISSSSFNFGFANAESFRIASGERGAAESIAATLLQPSQERSDFPIGSTITASYQYKVAENGALIPLETRITTRAAEREMGGQAERKARGNPGEERNTSLRDYFRPRTRLSPTDEVALFAASNLSGRFFSAPVRSATIGAIPLEARDENGEAVEAQILTGEENSALGISLAALNKLQRSVANLYARNNEVIYAATTITHLAA
jgi:hypothetical protein